MSTDAVNVTAFRQSILDLRNSSIPSALAFEAGKIFAQELAVMGSTIVDNLIMLEKEETFSSELLRTLDHPMLFSRWGLVEATDKAATKYMINSKGKLVVKFLKDNKQRQSETV